MPSVTKAEALAVIRRAYGPDRADAIAAELPDRIDPDDDGDAALLVRLGVTPERLVEALGGEL